MQIHLIVARARNGVIGRNGQLPWKLPEDLAYFKRTTLGHPIIMGRKTWDSLGRPLPGRLNIVITRRTDWQATGALRAGSFPEALKMARQALSPPNHTGMTDSPAKVFVIGGEQIYRQAMQDRPDVLHVTEVDIDVDGDAYFDRPSPHDWIETARVDFPVGPDRPLGFAIVEYRSRLTD